jgi:hypothetical protein
MQVAITGVRHGRDEHAVSERRLFDAEHHVGQPGPRHADILGQRGAEPLERRIGQPTQFEQVA